MKSPIMDQSYQSYGGLDRPLFGESSNREKYINYALGIITVVFVVATIIGAILQFNVPHIFLAGAILMNCITNILLIYWYRQGDLDPKFRRLIYYNTVVTILLCIAAFVIFFV